MKSIILSRRVTAATKLSQAIMKSGEGTAICKVGTACVPAKLKRTSRIIKNSL